MFHDIMVVYNSLRTDIRSLKRGSVLWHYSMATEKSVLISAITSNRLVYYGVMRGSMVMRRN